MKKKGHACAWSCFGKLFFQDYHKRCSTLEWCNNEKEVLRNIIISFGIRDEASRYIKLLDIDFDGTKWNSFVRKKLLAIVICTRDRHTFNIWVTNEYGIKESWTKQLSVGPLCVHRMVGCGRNEELLDFFLLTFFLNFSISL